MFLDLEKTVKTVSAEGPLDAKLAFVGEAPANDEFRTGRPFTGQAGSIFEQCLHSAGLTRHGCYITNVVKEQMPPKKKDMWYRERRIANQQRGVFTDRGRTWVESLKVELEKTSANIIVPMGNIALSALTWDGASGMAGISKKRGYIQESTLLPGRKILPAVHPAAALERGEGGAYINRYYTSHDFQKAKKESEYPEIRWKEPELIVPATKEECLERLREFYNAPIYSVDIEVVQYEVSCIGFCKDANTPHEVDGKTYHGWGLVVPLYQVWTESEEVEIWRAIAQVLGNPKTTKVLQNGIFDMSFLLQRNGIYIRGRIRDTMIAHHLMYPDFLKGLEFLGSVYLDFPYWKDMVKFKNVKGEA